jgi:hypothetical protein
MNEIWNIPHCMLTKHPYKLNANVSTRPAEKQQPRSGISTHAVSMSTYSRRPIVRDTPFWN